MDKKYTQEDIRKGFDNLARLRRENSHMAKTLWEVRAELATYQAQEVGQAMIKMGFTNNDARAAIAMLNRCIMGVALK